MDAPAPGTASNVPYPAEDCDGFLKRVAASDEDQFNLKRSVFEQLTGQPQTGLCGPVPASDNGNPMLAAARLWSRTCTEFCRDDRSRTNPRECIHGGTRSRLRLLLQRTDELL